jgi:hypothetical protein
MAIATRLSVAASTRGRSGADGDALRVVRSRATEARRAADQARP